MRENVTAVARRNCFICTTSAKTLYWCKHFFAVRKWSCKIFLLTHSVPKTHDRLPDPPSTINSFAVEECPTMRSIACALEEHVLKYRLDGIHLMNERLPAV
jgi:hypothetical protein